MAPLPFLPFHRGEDTRWPEGESRLFAMGTKFLRDVPTKPSRGYNSETSLRNGAAGRSSRRAEGLTLGLAALFHSLLNQRLDLVFALARNTGLQDLIRVADIVACHNESHHPQGLVG